MGLEIHIEKYLGRKEFLIMKKPKIIIFDYGQTLINELDFNPLKGTEAILENCAINPNNVTAAEIQKLAGEISGELRSYQNELYPDNYLEIHNHQFQNYIYDYFNIKITTTKNESERIFWEAAAPSEKTKNIDELLSYLENNDIKIGVLSNISFSEETLENRLRMFFPNLVFEFVISSAEYAFRKPNKRIFELTKNKAYDLFEGNLSDEEIWYCGDNLVWDIEGAHLSGVIPVWYRGYMENKDEPYPLNIPSINIDSWEELIEIIDTKY